MRARIAAILLSLPSLIFPAAARAADGSSSGPDPVGLTVIAVLAAGIIATVVAVSRKGRGRRGVDAARSAGRRKPASKPPVEAPVGMGFLEAVSPQPGKAARKAKARAKAKAQRQARKRNR